MVNLSQINLNYQVVMDNISDRSKNYYPKYISWLSCTSSALFFFFIIFQMSVFNTISADLMHAYSINLTQLGNLSSSYFYAAALALLPAGALLDRFKPRKQLLLVLGLCVISTFVFANYQSFWTAMLYRSLCGVGNAFAFLGCMLMASTWFSSKRTALVMGLMVTIGMIGGIVQTPFSLLVSLTSWQHAIIFDATIGVVIWLAMWFFLQDPPGVLKAKQAKTAIFDKQNINEFKAVLANMQNWFCSIYTALLNLPVMLLAALWGNLYLTQAHDLTKTEASFTTSMIFMGLILGSPLLGWLSDKINSRRTPMIGGALFSITIAVLIVYIPEWSFSMLAIAFFLLGFFTSAQTLSYPTVSESNPSNLTSTALAVVSIIIYIIGAVMEPLFGWLISLHAGHVMATRMSYSAADYQFALMILPIAFIASLMAAFLIRDTLVKDEEILNQNNPIPLRTH